ncbi:hypothetical protein [Flavobacterium phycosphaerae]|uniref:hypothetical protein n=1 Tax=Flavobacterium phycosphaerae TaxID=2697515 RepID=UPI00138960B7|nr:hypothetical protein [Flavobacterium phycosphaerae]
MENPSKVSAVLKKLPYDIILFFLFAFAITIFSFYLNLDINKKLKASLMPYTGWGFGRGYFFILFFIPLCLLSFKGTVDKTLRILRIAIIISMLMQLYIGIQDWLQVAPEDYTNPNPYLRYDTLTPIYTIFTPLFWTLLMAITLLWNYFKNKKETNLNLDTPA